MTDSASQLRSPPPPPVCEVHITTGLELKKHNTHCHVGPQVSGDLPQLPEGEEPGLHLLVGVCHAPILPQVLLLALPHQPLVLNYAHFVQTALILLALPPAVRQLVALVGEVLFLHRPQHLLVDDGTVLAKDGMPPLARAQHGVAVSLVVVVRRGLGVALERDGQKHVPARHADQLAHHLIRLFGVDVLEDVGGHDDVERVVLIRQVGQDSRLHITLGQHIVALFLKHCA
mmetsp:Transcript_29697/g.74236  ORF Transcript_29697/g.74236 Transcript_29697/m.74236 type:complete len:230 (+) Transcript_29697:356-1045(+)